MYLWGQRYGIASKATIGSTGIHMHASLSPSCSTPELDQALKNLNNKNKKIDTAKKDAKELDTSPKKKYKC